MTVEYNPFDPSQVDHQDEILTELRAECRVAELQPGVFYVTRHDDVTAIARQPAVFQQAAFSPLDEDTRSEDEKQLGESNPPGHTKVRKLFQSVLNPRRIRAMEPLVQSVCDELADDLATALAEGGPVDLMELVARPLPAGVIGHLAGVPEADRSLLHEFSDNVVGSIQEQDPVAKQAAADAIVDFEGQLLEVIRQRRASGEGPDDALRAFLEYRDDDGNGLSDEKILLHLSKDLITGGIDTTTHLVGNLFYDLLTTPGAYERVRDDRELVPVAVEECLRHRPVVSVLFRNPSEDTEVAGCPIPKDSIVALGFASANHDEEVFPHPERFDLDRGLDVRRHLGFGWGTHLCVGAPLARVEGAKVLNAVLDRVPAMELAPGFEYQRVRFFMMRGPVRLDVQLPA